MVHRAWGLGPSPITVTVWKKFNQSAFKKP